MKIILHADIPLKGKQAGGNKDGREEPLRSLDNNITKMVDRGYRAFWERRGLKPPPVASTFLEAIYHEECEPPRISVTD